MSIELLKKYLKSIEGLDESVADNLAVALDECLHCDLTKNNPAGQLYCLCGLICGAMFYAYNVNFQNMTGDQAEHAVKKNILPLFGKP